MVLRITYFFHEVTEDTERGIASGWSDADLSESGIRKSDELRSRIRDRHFDVVFSSDLRHAADTAGLIFRKGLQIIQDRRLRECNYGKLNGQPSAIVKSMRESNISTRYPQGESCRDVEDRMNDFLDFLKRDYDGKSVAIVSHKLPKLALECLINDKTWEQVFEEDRSKKGMWPQGEEYIVE
jgi:broad specificity phosphatase PhoE